MKLKQRLKEVSDGAVATKINNAFNKVEQSKDALAKAMFTEAKTGKLFLGINLREEKLTHLNFTHGELTMLVDKINEESLFDDVRVETGHKQVQNAIQFHWDK